MSEEVCLVFVWCFIIFTAGPLSFQAGVPPFPVGPFPFPTGSLLFRVYASLSEQVISPSAQVFRLYQNSHYSLEKDLFPVEFDSTDPGIVSNYPLIEALPHNLVMRLNGCLRALSLGDFECKTP